MHTHIIPPRSDRQADQRDHGEIATTTVLAAAGAAALVIAPTLVALTHGWDYRLAVLLGATLAAALARRYWRTLPRERVADRLAAAFAGSLAAGLVCTYAADWLDWRPLGLDDAVAGTTIGLLVLTVPLHRLLHHARHVPAAASLALLIFAAVPAVWAVFLSGFLGDALDPVVRSALIAGPGVAATLVVSVLGFAFALRRELYPAARLCRANRVEEPSSRRVRRRLRAAFTNVCSPNVKQCEGLVRRPTCACRLPAVTARLPLMPPSTPTNELADPTIIARIDRITRDLLAQLELQTQVVLNLLECAPDSQRETLLEKLAELRGRLVRLRASVLGAAKPQLVLARTRDGRG